VSSLYRSDLYRNTLTMLLPEPNLYEKVDKERDFAQFAKEIVAKNTEG
jgi:hypothetical protein